MGSENKSWMTYTNTTIGLKNSALGFCPILDKRSHRITLKVGVNGEEIVANPIFLTLGSSYFNNLITNFNQEDPFVLGPHLEAGDVQLIIQFLYTGSLRICEENVQSLLITATSFEMNDVENACMDFFKNNLTIGNIWERMEFLGKHAYPSLSEASHDFLINNLKAYIDSAFFLSLDFLNIEKLLISTNKSQRPPDVNNLDLLNAVLRWVEFDKKLRTEFLDSLVRVVMDYNPSISKPTDSSIQESGSSTPISASTIDHSNYPSTPRATNPPTITQKLYEKISKTLKMSAAKLSSNSTIIKNCDAPLTSQETNDDVNNIEMLDQIACSQVKEDIDEEFHIFMRSPSHKKLRDRTSSTKIREPPQTPTTPPNSSLEQSSTSGPMKLQPTSTPPKLPPYPESLKPPPVPRKLPYFPRPLESPMFGDSNGYSLRARKNLKRPNYKESDEYVDEDEENILPPHKIKRNGETESRLGTLGI